MDAPGDALAVLRNPMDLPLEFKSWLIKYIQLHLSLEELLSSSTTVTVAGSGGFGLTPTDVKTTDYTAAPGDFVPCDVSGNNVTIALPAAPADNSIVGVKVVKCDYANPYGISVACEGSDVFNLYGATGKTFAVLQDGQTFIAQYSATNSIWYVMVNSLNVGQVLVDAIVTARPGNTGGGSKYLDIRNSGNWQAGVITLPNDKSLAAYIGSGGSIRDLIRLDSTNRTFVGDVLSELFLKGSNFALGAGAGYGGGAGVVSIPNATTDPTSNPSGGGVLFVSGGALKYRGSAGTVTTIALA